VSTVFASTTTNSSANSVNIIIQYGFTGPPEDDGLSGVREPRIPNDGPPSLVARRQPDGTWSIPAAIAGGA
jgi:hypothetical protein